MNILIRNLSRDTTEAQIKELFVPFGEVQSCQLVLDKETGKSKGFGFVEMAKSGAARTAISKLNGLELDGMRIRVKKGNPKPEEEVNGNLDASE